LNGRGNSEARNEGLFCGTGGFRLFQKRAKSQIELTNLGISREPLMSNNELQHLAMQYLQGLQQAGIRDLPGTTERTLGTLRQAQPDVDQETDLHPMDTRPGEVTAESPGDYAAKADPSAASQPAGITQLPTAKPDRPAPAQFTVAIDTEYGPALSLDQRNQALESLRQTVSGCEKCPELSKCRTQTVFGVGNSQPRLVFFGEGPGSDEDRLGEPFVGRAGELLNKIIAACTMKREETYIMNTVKCRPPGNRNPHDTELANCREYWASQLEILQPDFICCLGSVAARTLLETTESVGRMRGKFHQYRSSQVVVTYHPAYLLRTPEAKAKTWDDMKMLMAAMGTQL